MMTLDQARSAASAQSKMHGMPTCVREKQDGTFYVSQIMGDNHECKAVAVFNEHGERQQ